MNAPPPTFDEFVARTWRPDCFERWRTSTRQRVESALRTQLLPTFGARRLDRIGPRKVHEWFDEYSQTAPAGANRALDVLHQILNHGMDCELIRTNAARGVVRNARPARTRFLSGAEVRRLHTAISAHRGRGSGKQQAEVLRLLLLTGCRRGEIIGLRWSEVDGDLLRLADSKTGPRPVFLSARAREILERQPRNGSPFVFPSLRDPSKPRSAELSLWRKVRKQAAIPGVRLHDLRHTFASHAVRCGTPLPVVSRLLGHSRARMTLRYAHVSDRDTEAAAERVGRAIAGLLDGVRRTPANVDREPPDRETA